MGLFMLCFMDKQACYPFILRCVFHSHRMFHATTAPPFNVPAYDHHDLQNIVLCLLSTEMWSRWLSRVHSSWLYLCFAQQAKYRLSYLCSTLSQGAPDFSYSRLGRALLLLGVLVVTMLVLPSPAWCQASADNALLA